MQKRVHRDRPAVATFFALIAALAVSGRATAAGDEAMLVLKDGSSLIGRFTEVGGVAESALSPNTSAGEVRNLTPIIVVDDGLRRTFVHNTQIQQLNTEVASRDVKIRVWQDVAERGAGIGRIGPALRVTPFDEFGRRIYELRSTEGIVTVVQGITLITPVYMKVEGLSGGNRPIVLDQRINPNSIPRETLSRVLTTAIKQDDCDARLEAVRFYLQSERYRDAGDELAQVVKDFPERKDLQDQIRQLRQLAARSMLKEIQLWAGAGRHQLVRRYLSQFPSEGVAGETLQEVRERLDKYALEDKRRESLIARLRAEIAKISDNNGRRLAEEFAAEIAAEVNEDAIGRLASFERLADDPAMSPEQKVGLAISGWLVGSAKAIDKFQTAISLADVRARVRQYLRDPIAVNRERVAAELRDLEGASADHVAQILKLMKPPLDAPNDAQRGPRCYELTVPGLEGQSDARYLVQLPPEYDPLRRYPAIVALSDLGVKPANTLDFWAGPPNQDNGERMGQAMRHGYIVIAVDWQQTHQVEYGYSAREHHAVLGSLRDACRRFSIDVDRVYLTGHGVGGDAVFDIALAHPDLWAGAVPIAALADRYCVRYWPNGQSLAWYIVAGELDGDKMSRNAKAVLDDRFMQPKFDATVVEYLGRGYEAFNDEIQRLFDWMGRRRRRKMPEKLEYVTMRPWDNFFWWVELSGMPEKSMVAPSTWPPASGERPFQMQANLTPTGKLIVTARTEGATVWLSPELVKFDQPLVVELNGRPMSRERFVRPDVMVLLEDARTRADRQHPFWAKLTAP
ncbi:MAG: peptidase [Pirellulales bacterium]